MLDAQFLAFLGVATLITITPGADMALVTKHALGGGRRAALLASLGVCAGLIAWATLSGIGLATLLNTSAAAFTLLKLAGAAYLVFLGLHAIWQSRGHPAATESAAADAAPTRGAVAFRQGLLSNLLNPKVGLFYTSLLPQFIAPGDPIFARTLLLALVHLLIGIAWLTAYVQFVVAAGDLLRRPRVKRWLDRATGAVLVALGLRLAAAER